MPRTGSDSELGRGARVVVPALGLLLVAHTVLVVLWLAPPNPVRDAVGGSFLSSYVDPYFEQGNDTLGIGSNRVDESLQIRAVVQDTVGGEPRTTDWIDVTLVETAAMRSSVVAPRSRQSARRLATTLNFAVFELSADQRGSLADIVADETDGQIRQGLRRGADNLVDIESFIGADEMARRYASLWLGAELSDTEILEVGYRVGRRQVPDLTDDPAGTVTGRPFRWVDLGWREPFRGTPEARSAFDDYVRSLRG